MSKKKITYQYESGEFAEEIDVKVELEFDNATLATIEHIAKLLGVIEATDKLLRIEK